MMGLIGFLLACVALVVAFCALVWLGLLIIGLLAIVAILAIAICIPMVAIGASSPGYEWLGALLGLGGSVAFLAVVWHYRPRSEPEAESKPKPTDRLEMLHRQTLEATVAPAVAIKPPKQELTSKPAPKQAEKAPPVRPQTRVDGPDADITRAWKQAENLAFAHADAIAEARDACARLLVASDADPFDTSLLDLAVKIRRNVPEFVSLSAQALSRAESDQKRIVRNDLVLSLTALGRQSRDALAAIHKRHDEKREALSRHLQNGLENPF